jgi:hypothetical protein
MKDLAFYTKLATDAIPFDDDEWGSARQINAVNLFCYEFEKRVSAEDYDTWEFNSYKALEEEYTEHALHILKTKYFGEQQ